MSVVTFYFDLSVLPDSVSRLGKDHYYTHGKKVMAIPQPMILFTDEACKEDLIRQRDNLPLHVITYPSLTDIPFYQEWIGPISQLRRTDLPVFRDPRNTTSSAVLYLMKLWIFREAIQLNPFQTSHFLFADYALGKMQEEDQIDYSYLFTHLPDRFRITHIRSHAVGEFNDVSFYYTVRCCAAAGVFSCSGAFFEGVWERYLQTLEKHVRMGYIHTEEQLFGDMIVNYPDLFDLTYGDYYFLLSNFIDIHHNLELIVELSVKKAMANGNRELARDACEKTLKGCGKYSISFPEMEEIAKQF